MKTIEDLLRAHPFLAEHVSDHLALIAGCGENRHFKEGAYLAREGEPADAFFVIRSGHVAIETAVPGHGPVVLQTLGSGDVAGWSWIVPPYRWTFDLRAVEASATVALDGRCLRSKCEANPALGYALLKAFAGMMSERLRSSRLQQLDLYGKDRSAAPGRQA